MQQGKWGYATYMDRWRKVHHWGVPSLQKMHFQDASSHSYKCLNTMQRNCFKYFCFKRSKSETTHMCESSTQGMLNSHGKIIDIEKKRVYDYKALVVNISGHSQTVSSHTKKYKWLKKKTLRIFRISTEIFARIEPIITGLRRKKWWYERMLWENQTEYEMERYLWKCGYKP